MKMKEFKLFKCEICKNITAGVVNAGGPLACCGKPMTELKANTQEASLEKHLPEVTIDGDVLKVKVGSVLHPMTEEHYIQFIAVEFSDGSYTIHPLLPVNEPEAEFPVKGKDPVGVYEYCNLHGLWLTKMDK